MKIDEIGLFHTPATFKEVELWIERHPPEDRAHLITAALMTWNLCAHITNNLNDDGNEIAKED